MYMYKVDLQVFPSKKLFFFSLFLLLFVCLVSSPHAPLFSLASQPMMLQRWKTAGVIFTGGQGTWVIKLASIFHSQKKKLVPPPPPNSTFTFPCQSTRPPWEVCIIPRRLWESEDVLRHGGLNSRHGQDHLTHTHAGGF